MSRGKVHSESVERSDPDGFRGGLIAARFVDAGHSLRMSRIRSFFPCVISNRMQSGTSILGGGGLLGHSLYSV
jgi:hypothetical protein